MPLIGSLDELGKYRIKGRFFAEATLEGSISEECAKIVGREHAIFVVEASFSVVEPRPLWNRRYTLIPTATIIYSHHITGTQPDMPLEIIGEDEMRNFSGTEKALFKEIKKDIASKRMYDKDRYYPPDNFSEKFRLWLWQKLQGVKGSLGSYPASLWIVDYAFTKAKNCAYNNGEGEKFCNSIEKEMREKNISLDTFCGSIL